VARPIYFVSDVHLSPDASDRTALFLRFLDVLRGSGGALYILGDLFDFWVGPKHERLPSYRTTLQQLEALARSGVPVRFLHGNRDFYLDRSVADRYGVELLGDEAVLRQSDRQILLTHGDLLCATSRSYRFCRRLFRSRPVAGVFKRLPLKWGCALARVYRRISRRTAANNGPKPTTFCESALHKAFAAGADVIVCGHGHQVATRYFDDGGPRTLYMLGAWAHGGSYLVLQDGRFSFHTLSHDDHHGNTEHDD